MVSNLILLMIHLRLHQVLIGNLDEVLDLEILFGNIDIIFFGDLLQLSPVNANFCFEVLSQAIRSAILSPIGKLSNPYIKFNSFFLYY